ncbi:acyltransferase-domain-containing protein [Microthyrium microscopicum]|uniref:Acyltransferase-domain-containing protein n=1 Tax=Microthyrium microscopicum TaxID=703497 RepID=A0A6A6UIV8_9PEZI|nr:acyltransferase-domain-containing protein [Microthyrium microscopicum]
MKMAPNPLLDFGAGLTTRTPASDVGPKQHGKTGQVERAFTAGSTFLSGILAISASQFLGAPLKAIDPKFYQTYMAYTKQSFGVLITTMTQWWSPTIVRVSGDKSIPKQLFLKKDGTLNCKFPKRLVMMANHQLYTDWLYLWWVAYTNNMHGYIYIILKESLKNVPIIGWGAQFYNFIFLSRKWETDQKQFREHLQGLNQPDDPMWLLIFPEGTNLATGTRAKSAEWAERTGVQDMKHQLLPRSRGLQFTLQNLHETTEWLYDCTIGYEGIPPGQFGQDVFTLRSSMFEGRPPKSVNMHFRRFKISAIPIDDDQAFDVWLRNRWREKDYLLEHFTRFNRFPDDVSWMSQQQKTGRKQLIAQPAKSIETQIKSNSLEEFLSIFAPVTSVMAMLALANGASSSDDLMKLITQAGEKGKGALGMAKDKTTKGQRQELQKAQEKDFPNLASMNEISKLTPESAQMELIQKYLNSVPLAMSGQLAPPNLPPQPPPNLASPLKKAKSVQSQPAARAKSGIVGKKKGPASAAASAPAMKGKTPVNKVPPVPPIPSIPPTHRRQYSLKTTVHPGSSVSRSGDDPDLPIPRSKPIVPNPRTPKSILKPTNSAPMQAKKATPAPTTKKGIKIDPKVLSQMKATKPTPSAPKTVTVNPAILAQMKQKNAPPPPPKGIKIDPAMLNKMKSQGRKT